MDSYEEKQEARRERIQNAADKARAGSISAYNQSHDEAQRVPLGQPILVGHHSEGKMRAHYNRVGRLMDKSCSLSAKAEYLQQKAASVGSGGISSDDPEAVVKLKEKLSGMEQQREKMKSINKIVRSKPKNIETPEKTKLLMAMGINLAATENLFLPDFCGRIGIAAYQLTNLGANIRSTKKRIESLSAKSELESYKIPFDGGSIEVNYEENRVQIFHDEKPSVEIRSELKHNGFRWSRYNGCWQRFAGNNSIWLAKSVCNIK